MEDLFDPVKAKAAGILALVGAGIGALFLISEPVGSIALVGAFTGYWVIGQLIAKRHPKPDVFDGPAELTHRALLEVTELAHRAPEYAEAATYLGLAEDSLREASGRSLTANP
jgi:hypothetical protein